MFEDWKGNSYKDTATGLVGTAISRSEDVDGGIEYLLRPHATHEGSAVKAMWFPEWVLILVEPQG